MPTYEPFPICDESYQVDSTYRIYKEPYDNPSGQSVVEVNAYRYRHGTCFPSQIVYHTGAIRYGILNYSYRDTSYFAYRADGLVADVTHRDNPHLATLDMTYYFSPGAELDSTVQLSEEVWDPDSVQSVYTFISRNLKLSGYRLEESLFILPNGTVRRSNLDSILFDEKGYTSYSKDYEHEAKIRCERSVDRLTCTLVETNENLPSWKTQVWHLTSNQVDSVELFNDSGKVWSTTRWFWSPRNSASIHPGAGQHRSRGRIVGSALNHPRVDGLGRKAGKATPSFQRRHERL